MTEISDDMPGLFGWAPAPPRGQGRPAFAWTREKSNKVMCLFAAGYQHKVVAAAIGCDAKTLRKVFPAECRAQAMAALVVRSGMMARLVTEAEGGNVGAIKQLDRMLDAEKVRATGDQLVERRKTEAKVPKLGKKEEAKVAAENATGRFGARNPPPALLN